MGKKSKNEKETNTNNVENYKYNKKVPILRTKEERKEEIRIIINKLSELELTIAYEPIKELFLLMQKYVNDGGKIKVNIQFTMINRIIKGLLSDTVNEKCWIILENIYFIYKIDNNYINIIYKYYIL